jgi:hypothetical protein
VWTAKGKRRCAALGITANYRACDTPTPALKFAAKYD